MNLFSEICGTYFRITAKLLENEYTDEKTVSEMIRREGFRDTMLFLPQKIISDPPDAGLFTRCPDGRYRRITKKAPAKVLTKIQKMWLRSKLSDPRIRLFLDEETLSRLGEKLADIPPLYREDHFSVIDKFTDSDDFSDKNYILNFRKILDAVKKRKIIAIGFTSGHGRKISSCFLPLKIEYSPKNDKFRVHCYHLRYGKIYDTAIINIGRVEYVNDTGKVFCDNISAEEYFSMRKCSSPAVIKVTSERNGAERFMTEFASYEKHTVRDLEKGEYTVELWYDSRDETELLIRLLSFGPVIEILSPPNLRAQAAERVRKQAEYFSRHFCEDPGE